MGQRNSLSGKGGCGWAPSRTTDLDGRKNRLEIIRAWSELEFLLVGTCSLGYFDWDHLLGNSAWDLSFGNFLL